MRLTYALITAADWLEGQRWAALPAIASALFAYFIGATGNAVVVVTLNFMLLDFLTGLLRGGLLRNLSSGVAGRGLTKKAGFLCAVGFGHQIDLWLGTGDTCKTLFAHLIIGVEGLSITENLSEAGVLPKAWQAALQRLFENATDGALVSLDALAKTRTAEERKPQ